MRGTCLSLSIAVLMVSGGCCARREQSHLAAVFDNPTQSDLTALENSGTQGVVWLIGWLEYDCVFQVMEINSVPSVYVSQIGVGFGQVEAGGLTRPVDRALRKASLILTHPLIVNWAKARGSVK
jgi:hypothetical protein